LPPSQDDPLARYIWGIGNVAVGSQALYALILHCNARRRAGRQWRWAEPRV